MREPTRSETQRGLADLKKRFATRGITILEQQRPWGERLATYFAIGNSESRTNIVIQDTFLDDLPNTKGHQAAVDSYASAVAGRTKCGSPELFYCPSGIAVQISIDWPLRSSGIQTWMISEVIREPDGQIAKCASELEGLGFNRTVFGDVAYVVNHIRRAVDAGELLFYEPNIYQEKYQQPKGVAQEQGKQRSNLDVERFIAGKTYVLGFLAAKEHDCQVWTQDPWDAEYLGVTVRELRLATRTLKAQGWIELDSSLEYARPTDKLLAIQTDQNSGTPATQKLSRLNLPTKESLISDIKTDLVGKAALAVVLIDLDNFKQLNDTQGHQAGDECLDRTVDTIATILGRRGKLYRWGAGDEFVVVLPDLSTAEAQATAERIRVAVEQNKTEGDVQVTSSVGVCGTDLANTNSAQELLDFADQAMYRSKQSGKNRVTTWGY